MDFEQIVLALKERQQFPLRDLVEFGADQRNLKKTLQILEEKKLVLYFNNSILLVI